MAHNLFLLGKLTGNNSYEKQSKEMTARISTRVLENILYFSHWAEIMLLRLHPYYVIVIVGQKAESIYRKITKSYLPNCVIAFSTHREESNTLFKGRYKENDTLIYICRNNSCGLPVRTVDEVLEQINKKDCPL